MKSIGLFVIAMFFLCGTTYAERTVWYVHPDSALNTIQAGVNSCADNDIVLVGPGTYYENIVWPNTQGIHLISELGPEVTVIDGDSVGTVIEITSGVDSNTIVGGFSIQNGYTLSKGAGIRCNTGSSPTIMNNIITNNFADSSGGGLYCDSASSALITGNTIISNRLWQGGMFTEGQGGAICCYYSSPTISNNYITDNSVRAGYGHGGGIYCGSSSSPIISGNTITYNTASGNIAGGGGICCISSSPSIIGNHIIGNIACADMDASGGGIDCWSSSSPIIADNTISENSPGGVSCYGASSPMLTNNTINDNSWFGIFCNQSSPSIDSCTITGNSCFGVWCMSSSTPIVHNCDITGHSRYGINNEGPLVVNAESNWWGDVTGPYHPTLNPGGLGDSVSDYVDFDPWLSWPVGVEERPIVKPIEQQVGLTATIFRGPLQLPEGEKCKVYDITGRVVEPSKIHPGIYFIEVDGVVTQKVVKVR
jgi:parallel beta-helix repeat protein